MTPPPPPPAGRTTVLAVSASLHLTVVYEDAGDGWIMASIPQVPGVRSQGRTREEARENVPDALREMLLYRLGVDVGADNGGDAGESLDVIIA
jgi:hypothetical protein